MATAPPPAYPDDKQWSNAREVVFVMPPGTVAAGPAAAPAAAAPAPANGNLEVVKKEMGNLTRVSESLMEYIKTQVDSTFAGEYPGKERWTDFVGTVREQVADLEEATKRYALYLNMSHMSADEGTKLKIPMVLLLDLVKRTVSAVETSKVVEKHAIKTGLFSKKADKEHKMTEDSRIATAIANIRSQVAIDKVDLNQFKVGVGQLGGVVLIDGFTESEINLSNSK